MFERLGQNNDQLCKEDFAKSQIERKEPTIVVFLSCSTLNWECWSYVTTFSKNVCDTDKYEENKIDSNSLYLVVAEKELYDCVRSEKKTKLGVVTQQKL